MVCTTERHRLWVIEVVHTAEQRLEAVLLWIDQLLATKDLLEQGVVVVLLWIKFLRNQRGLQHLQRCGFARRQLLYVWLDAEGSRTTT